MLCGLLDRQDEAHSAAALVGALASLDPTEDDAGRDTTMLCGLLDRQDEAHSAAARVRRAGVARPDRRRQPPGSRARRLRCCSTIWFIKLNGPKPIAEFVASLVSLTRQYPPDRSEALRGLLAEPGLAGDELAVTVAQELRDLVVQLANTSEDRRQARSVLLSIAVGRHRLPPDRRLVEARAQLARRTRKKTRGPKRTAGVGTHRYRPLGGLTGLAWGLAQPPAPLRKGA